MLSNGNQALEADPSLPLFSMQLIQQLIAKYWRMILAIGVTSIVVGGAFWFLQLQFGPLYQSDAAVLLTGSKYKLEFEPKIVDSEGLAGAPVLNSTLRLQEYKTIAESLEVRRAAARLVPEDVPSGEVEQRTVDVRVSGALIRLQVTANKPDRAARIAGAYAQALAQRMDTVYGTADQSTLEQLVKDAVMKHKTAEEALASYTSKNTIQSLQRVLEQRESAKAAIVGEINTSLSRRISFFYSAILEIDRLRRDAESLRGQINDAGKSPASRTAQTLALLNLESRLIAIGSAGADIRAEASKDARANVSPPVQAGVQLQMSLDSILGREGSREQMQSDVETLLHSIDRRQNELRQEYGRYVNELAGQISGVGQALFAAGARDSDGVALKLIDQLTGETIQYEATLLRQKAELADLQRNVDQTKQTRITLEGKLQESNVSSAVSGGRAMIVASPTVPKFAMYPPSLSQTLPLAGIAGLLLGLAVALALEYRTGVNADRGRPFGRQRAIPLEPSIVEK